MRQPNEDPIDFPVAWNWHRHYSQYYGQGDPGPNEECHQPVEHNKVMAESPNGKVYADRILALEERVFKKQEAEIKARKGIASQGLKID